MLRNICLDCKTLKEKKNKVTAMQVSIVLSLRDEKVVMTKRFCEVANALILT